MNYRQRWIARPSDEHRTSRTRVRWLAQCALALLVCVATSTVSFAAPPKLTSLFPAGIQRGQSATITATGEFSAWPVDVWIDRPGLTIAAEADKGKLKVTAAADANPGVYWVRLVHAEGASNLRPIVVGTLPEVEEVEPNDTPDKPQILSNATVVNGRLAKAGDVDTYALRLRKGETLAAALEANVPLGSPMDGVLQIAWLSGPSYDDASPAIPLTATGTRRLDAFVLEQDDDGAGYDPRLSFIAPRDGWYVVRTFAFPTETNATIGYAGGDTYIYRLTIATAGLVESTWPLAATAGGTTSLRMTGWHLPASLLAQEKPLAAPPRDPKQVGVADQIDVSFDGVPGTGHVRVFEGPSLIADEASDPKSPQTVPVPSIVSGRIEAPRDVDAFSFTAVKGKKIRLSVEARALGFPLDPILTITDAAGKQLAENDDAGKGRDSELTFTASVDGSYLALVRDVHRHGGPRHAYRLSLVEGGLDFALTLAADSFILAADKPLEIPVTVDRRDGLDQPIEVSVQGLPDGVTAAAVISEPKGDSAKTVKLSLSVAAGTKFTMRGVPVRIVGRVTAEPPRFRLATFVTGVAQASHQDAWLTLPNP